MNERRLFCRVARCIGEVCLTPSQRSLGFSSTSKDRHDMGPLHRRIDRACGRYLLKPEKFEKAHSRRPCVSNPHLLAHRPFGLSTGPGEPNGAS
jgi:hypothetical protein